MQPHSGLVNWLRAEANRLGMIGHAGFRLLPMRGRCRFDLHETVALWLADPIDPAAPSCRSLGKSNSRYLKLVEPRLATRTFMTTPSALVADAKNSVQH